MLTSCGGGRGVALGSGMSQPVNVRTNTIRITGTNRVFIRRMNPLLSSEARNVTVSRVKYPHKNYTTFQIIKAFR
jgi:hypothetical protein